MLLRSVERRADLLRCQLARHADALDRRPDIANGPDALDKPGAPQVVNSLCRNQFLKRLRLNVMERGLHDTAAEKLLGLDAVDDAVFVGHWPLNSAAIR